MLFLNREEGELVAHKREGTSLAELMDALHELGPKIVVITDGPFKDLEGKVGEIDEDRGKVKVMVSMFGRETPVELDFLQIRKL